MGKLVKVVFTHVSPERRSRQGQRDQEARAGHGAGWRLVGMGQAGSWQAWGMLEAGRHKAGWRLAGMG